MELVNNPVQVIGVKALALADLAAIRAELFQLLENLLQTLVGVDAVIDQLVNRFGDRVINVAADRIGRKPAFVARLLGDDARGYADRCRARRHILDYHRVRADARTVPDLDRPQDLGAGAEHDPVAQRRVPLALVPRGAAERDAVVKRAVVTDLRGFADHHAHAVIDEKPPP